MINPSDQYPLLATANHSPADESAAMLLQILSGSVMGAFAPEKPSRASAQTSALAASAQPEQSSSIESTRMEKRDAAVRDDVLGRVLNRFLASVHDEPNPRRLTSSCELARFPH